MEFTVAAIAKVVGGRQDPADSDYWGAVTTSIVVEERFGDDCLTGLAEFSHVEVVFVFDRANERSDYRGLWPARSRADMPGVGVFCGRSPRRPNRIGVTMCRILAVSGRELQVRGLDAVDGTPILDLKPVMRELLPTDVHQPQWVSTLMGDYLSE